MKGYFLTSQLMWEIDHIYQNVNPDVSYEDTLEDMEKTMGNVPVFMKYLPKKVLIITGLHGRWLMR